MADAAGGCADAAGGRRAGDAVLDLLGAGVRRARWCCSSARRQRRRRAVRRGVAGPARRAGSSAWPLSEQPHEAGLAALHQAGGRVVTEAPPPGARPRGRRHRRDRWAAGAAGPTRRGARGTRAGSRSSRSTCPSGVDVDTGELDGHAVRADVTVTFGTHKVALLVDPAAEHAGVVHLVDIGLDLPDAASRACRPPTSRRCCRGPPRTAEVHPRRGRRPRRLSDVPRRRRAVRRRGGVGLCGMVRYVAGAARRGASPHTPTWSTENGRVQAWTVGSGGGPDVGHHAGRGAGQRRTDRGRRRRAHPRRRARSACRPCSPRTPASCPG